MSKTLDVVKAVKALVEHALPGADVRGMDVDAAKPARIPPNGLAIVRRAGPGTPEIDLSPLTYNYEHAIPVELAAYQSSGRTPAEALDDMLGAIGTEIEADRTLGGLVEFLEAVAPDFDDITAEGADVAAGTELLIVATYATTSPLN